MNRLWLLLLTLTGGCVAMMPGKSYHGPLPPLTAEEIELREKLYQHVDMLAGTIGVRNVEWPGTLDTSAAYISKIWNNYGYAVAEQPYGAVKNVEVEIRGATKADEIIVVGAHYDSVTTGPGANDNASAVAAMLEISRLLKDNKPQRTIRFVAFVNEEPPFFQTDQMGSVVYAKRCRQRGEKIVGMISLETIGCYFDGPHTQQYPWPLGMFYPSTGNFISFVGDTSSSKLVKDCVRSFRSHTKFPSEGGAAPRWIKGIGWSDHWSFWQQGYPALMVTDTAPFRYAHYHLPTDTPDKIDYEKMTRVVMGMKRVIKELADAE